MFGNSRYRPHRLGQQAETIARDFLLTQGLRLLRQNFRSRQGEIDLIMSQGDSLVFIEVRYRTREDYGGALASVDSRKQRRIIRCASITYASTRTSNTYPYLRFDVVCVELGERSPKCQWIQHAFEAF